MNHPIILSILLCSLDDFSVDIRENKKIKVPLNISKVLTYLMVAVFGLSTIGGQIALDNSSAINTEFHIQTQQIINPVDEEHKEKLKDGIIINGKRYHPAIKTPDEVTDLDLALVATKYRGLESAFFCLQQASTDSTVILSLLNGVDSEQKIKEAGVKVEVLPYKK